MAEIFAALDADGDGEVSRVEFTSAFKPFDTASMSVVLAAQESETTFADRLMEVLDADEDGSVSEEEFTAAMEEQAGGAANASGATAESLFADLDLNDDGAVDAPELEAYLAHATAVMPEAMTASTRQAEAETSGENTPPPPPPPGGGGDSASETFDPLDTNQDGVVSAEERAAARISIEA